LEQRVRAISSFLAWRGISAADAHAAAIANVYRQLGAQAHFLGFMDCFRVMGWVMLAAVALTLLIRRVHGRSVAGGH
jgi:DHA2 family multidrug resistance protein